jgi:hypothetical protein
VGLDAVFFVTGFWPAILSMVVGHINPLRYRTYSTCGRNDVRYCWSLASCRYIRRCSVRSSRYLTVISRSKLSRLSYCAYYYIRCRCLNRIVL